MRERSDVQPKWTFMIFAKQIKHKLHHEGYQLNARIKRRNITLVKLDFSSLKSNNRDRWKRAFRVMTIPLIAFSEKSVLVIIENRYLI